MSNHEHLITIATRACELAGLKPSAARCYALMAVAENLIKQAEALSLSAQFADRMEYKRRDEEKAEQLRQLALDLATEADGIAGDETEMPA